MLSVKGVKVLKKIMGPCPFIFGRPEKKGKNEIENKILN